MEGKMNFKVGDRVVYIKHTNHADVLKFRPDQSKSDTEYQRKNDKKTFEIGKYYTISYVNEVDSLIKFEENSGSVYPFQITLGVPNNKLSKVLYPDYEVWSENPDYLIPRR